MSDRALVYHQARWKAVLMGLSGIMFCVLALSSFSFMRPWGWPIFIPLIFLLGCRAVYLGLESWSGSERLIVSAEGILFRDGDSVRQIAWDEVSAIGVTSDEGASSLDIWTDGKQPFLSTSGWNRTPAEIAADIRDFRRVTKHSA